MRDGGLKDLYVSLVYATHTSPFPIMASSRKCSHCGGNGHNSRTCAERVCVKLFGVRISDSCGSTAAMRKSSSMGNLAASSSSAFDVRQDGYASDDLIHTTSKSHERKKGVPWTEEEHKLFLVALRKLGKGDWRGISKNFVKTRSPTQVASHAQKYFLRQSNLNKRRRRSSLFDMTPDAVPGNATEETLQQSSALHSDLNIVKDRSLLGKMSDSSDLPHAPNKASNEAENHRTTKFDIPANGRFPGWDGVDPALLFYYTWPRLQEFPHPGGFVHSESKIVKPIPISFTAVINTDTSATSLELSKDATRPAIERTSLSHQLSENVSRHSAFHTLSSPELNSQGSLCNVISVA